MFSFLYVGSVEVVFKVLIVEGVLDLDMELVLFNKEFICMSLLEFRFLNGLNFWWLVGNVIRDLLVERIFVLVKYFLIVDFDMFF